MNFVLRLSACLVVIVLSSCVPTITKVYLAPVVKGRVIDLATLQPLMNTNVAHTQSTDKFVETNEDGEFELPSISNTEFKMMMAGHAIKNSTISIYNRSNRIAVEVSATLNGRFEETSELGTVIFDSQPKVIAPSSSGKLLEHNLLRGYFYHHSLLGSCDSELAVASLNGLNTSRKLSSLAAQQENDSKGYKQLSMQSYQRTAELWRALKSTCERSTGNYKQLDEVFDEIEKEVKMARK
ncbi:MAG: hypothetical protein KUG78_05980 [Kangiellaceae bacterium]|nr:hypothetical protein [Kangiellaceae bacterium]